MKSLFSKTILLVTLLVCIRAWADTPPDPFKSYRNEDLGIEFRYPGDMQVTTTTNSSVLLAYRSLGEHGPVDVQASIHIDPSISVDACLTTWYANPSTRESIVGAPQVNEFYVGDNTTDCGMGGSCLLAQHYVRPIHQGQCYSITRTEWASKRWFKDKVEPEDQKRKDDLDKHYDAATEIVKSFRFIKGKPKPK